MLNIKQVLVLSPHPDDGVMGCGGTLTVLAEQGITVRYIAFSLCAESIQRPFSKDVLQTETNCAAQRLGITDVLIENYPVRHFPEYRQAILERLIQIKCEVAPDIVFIPNPHDTHQDHQVIYWEGRRAFQNISVVSYELPWKSQVFQASLFVRLQEKHLQRKNVALRCYQSQQHRYYIDEDLFMSLAKLRGKQAGVDLAEAFQVIRWIL